MIERRRPIAVANLLAAVAFFAMSLSTAIGAAPASSTTWSFDMYDPAAVLYQDPDYTACASAAAQIMLNTAFDVSEQDYVSSGTEMFHLSMRWQPDTSAATMETILAYSRANMTMLTSSLGTDPHGWRNSLNYFGWGTMRGGVYSDTAYTSFADAAKAVVASLARSHKPVGLLARAGTHAQLVTGYVVTGENPTVSDNYTVVGVYLTDPLRSAAMRDAWIPLSTWQSGVYAIRFTPYTETDSPYTDPIDHNVGITEWYGKWVIIGAWQ